MSCHFISNQMNTRNMGGDFIFIKNVYNKNTENKCHVMKQCSTL